MAKKNVDFMKTGIIPEYGFFGGEVKNTEEKKTEKKPAKKTTKKK